jgi:hypothetical protein
MSSVVAGPMSADAISTRKTSTASYNDPRRSSLDMILFFAYDAPYDIVAFRNGGASASLTGRQHSAAGSH